MVACNISIHAPLAGCDVNHVALIRAYRISIHAPLAGCDKWLRQSESPREHFNPRTPCGVRLAILSSFTLPDDISIHAPLAGCDPPYGYGIVRLNKFQSTHPLRGATPESTPPPIDKAFQSTHPLRGATSIRIIQQAISRISIHAPLAGCDTAATPPCYTGVDFNPRTPCGVRPLFGLQWCGV